MSSAAVCAYSRGLAVDPVYSLAITDRRVRTSNRRTSTRNVPGPVRSTLPVTRPSAPSSRHRSNGISANDRAAGIVL